MLSSFIKSSANTCPFPSPKLKNVAFQFGARVLDALGKVNPSNSIPVSVTCCLVGVRAWMTVGFARLDHAAMPSDSKTPANTAPSRQDDLPYISEHPFLVAFPRPVIRLAAVFG